MDLATLNKFVTYVKATKKSLYQILILDCYSENLFTK